MESEFVFRRHRGREGKRREGLPYRFPVQAVQLTLLYTGSIGPDSDLSFSQAASIYKLSSFVCNKTNWMH